MKGKTLLVSAKKGGSALPKPAEPDAPLTPAEKKKKVKVSRQWREMMDFLFRHLATITFRFNTFFNKSLTDFAKAMSDGDDLRSQLKLKKSDKPRIWNLKTMLEAADLLDAAQQEEEADKLRTLADLSGRTRTWGLMAGDMLKMIPRKQGLTDEEKETENEEVEWRKSLLDSIQGFTNRTVDYGVLRYVFKIDLSEYTELEKQYLQWPVAVRTALFACAQFLKMASEVSGTPILPPGDPTYFLENMQRGEFVLALNLNDLLNDIDTEAEKQRTLLLGKSAAAKKQTWKIPNVDHIEPELLQPIADRSLLLQFPVAEPPTRKNKDKKKRK